MSIVVIKKPELHNIILKRVFRVKKQNDRIIPQVTVK